MPKKRTPKIKKSVSAVASFSQPIKKFFVAIWDVIKILARALLILLDKILRFVVALVLALAKIIQAVALAFTAIFAALALLALTFFLFSRAVDLPNSENFQQFRDRTIEVFSEAAEPGFATWEANVGAWVEYRAALQELAASDLSDEEKAEKFSELRDELHENLKIYNPYFIERELKNSEK